MTTSPIRVRAVCGTTAQWTADDIVLALGERGLDTDQRRTKLGDGVTAWSALPWEYEEFEDLLEISSSQINDIGDFSKKDETVTSVNHGADANIARPEGFTTVIWFGSVEPVNAAEQDIWFSDEGLGIITDHNELDGLQGGQEDEYYHLTEDEHTIATQPASATQDGYLTKEKFEEFENKLDAADVPTDLEDLTDENDLYEKTARKGQANGYAPLDEAGKVPVEHLPSKLLKFKGVWDADENDPELPATDIARAGQVYRVNVAGEQFGIEFYVGDWLVYNDVGVAQVARNGDNVVRVNGQQGDVTLELSDITDKDLIEHAEDSGKAYVSQGGDWAAVQFVGGQTPAEIVALNALYD